MAFSNFIFFLLIFLLSVSGFSQSVHKGYIVNHRLDTIRGEIKGNSRALEEITCQFRHPDSVEFYQYFVNEIVGYGYNKKFFEAKKLSEGKTIKRVFLQKLFAGEISLYRNRQIFVEKTFYIEKPGVGIVVIPRVKEVIKRKKDKYGKEFDVKVRSKRHKAVMEYFLAETPSLHNEIPTIDFTEKSLIKIATKYHSLVCQDGEDCITYYYEN